MPSKGVIDRQRIAKSIVAAARTHAHQVGAQLDELLSPYLFEGETFTPTTFQLVIARLPGPRRSDPGPPAAAPARGGRR